MPRSWFDSFVDSALLPLLPSMDAPSLASTAAALPALGSSLGGDRRQQVLRQLEEVVGVALQRDEREANIGADAFPMDSLAQVCGKGKRVQGG